MTVISTPEAPEAIGPYAQAIEANGFIFCSGQLAINPASGEIEVVGAAEQMMRVLLNLRAVLEAAGSGLDRVVKTTLFLTDIGDFRLSTRSTARCSATTDRRDRLSKWRACRGAHASSLRRSRSSTRQAIEREKHP